MSSSKKSFVDSRWFYRLLERIPATISWLILLSPLLLSMIYPVPIGIFLAIFTFFWFIDTIEYVVFVLISQFQYRYNLKINFGKLVKRWDSSRNLSQKDLQLKNNLKQKGKYISGKDVKHLVFVATYKEPFEVLDDSLKAISKVYTDSKNIYLCLAGEERGGESQLKILQKIEAKYKDKFGKFWLTIHPDGIEGEVKGKGGNITYAGREVTKSLVKDGENLDNVIVTTLDADHQPHPEYFNAVTLKFVKDEFRQHKSYQPISLFYNNIWDVPMINRLIAIAGGFWHMSENAKAYRLHNFASHAQPLKALIDMDFWSVTTIVEDGHQYWRSYFHFKGEYEVEPIFLPIYQDAVQSADYKTSLISQYKQIRRWAWGASDIPFVLYKWIKDFKKLPFWETLINFFRLLSSHIFWATGAIVITLSTPIPEYINDEYARSIYAVNIAGLLGFLFKIVFAGLIMGILLSLITLPKPKRKSDYFKVVIQWLFVPVATIFFSAIPAIESQTRLFLGKYLGFDVTVKHRSNIKVD